MLTYTNSINTYKDFTKDTSTENVNRGKSLMNEAIRKITSSLDWGFIEKTDTITTVASQQFYNLPFDYKKLQSVKITVSSTDYIPQQISNKKQWDWINSSTSPTSDIPTYYYILNDTIGFYPTHASSSNTITVTYKKRVVDVSVADYVTGTVTLTNGSTTVTGSGTTFTAAMVGRWIKGDNDKNWYKIGGFTSTTVLTLKKAFQGTTASGLSYTIGEISDLPEDYQMLPIYWAASQYWMFMGNDTNKSTYFLNLYQVGMDEMKSEFGMKTEDLMIQGLGDMEPINPNLYPSNLT